MSKLHPTRAAWAMFAARAVLSMLFLLFMLTGCATVKPQDRALLADPIMQFDGDPLANPRVQHAIDNREGSHGGSGVSGGGCGCN